MELPLRLLDSKDPLPHLEIQNLGIQRQTLLGKREKKLVFRKLRKRVKLVETPAKFEFKEETKGPILPQVTYTVPPMTFKDGTKKKWS